MSEIDSDNDIFSKEIKSGTSDSVLASLYRSILFDLNINPHRFNYLLARYFINKNINNNTETISSLRGNLKKELFKETMSWKVFIKGLSFLSIKKFEIKVTLHHSGNVTSEHFKTVIIDEYTDDAVVKKPHKKGHKDE